MSNYLYIYPSGSLHICGSTCLCICLSVCVYLRLVPTYVGTQFPHITLIGLSKGCSLPSLILLEPNLHPHSDVCLWPMSERRLPMQRGNMFQSGINLPAGHNISRYWIRRVVHWQRFGLLVRVPQKRKPQRHAPPSDCLPTFR